MESSDLVVLALYVCELTLIARSAAKYGWAPSPTLIMSWILGEQIVLWLVHAGAIEYKFMLVWSRGGIDAFFLQTQIFYFCLALFFFLCHAGLSADRAPISRRLIGKAIIGTRLLRTINLPSACFVIFVFVAFCATIDWSIAWRNTQYLSMTTPAIIAPLSPWSFLVRLLSVAGMYCGMLSAINFARGSKEWGAAFFVLASFPLIYALGAHSRAAALAPIAFLATFNIVSSKNRLFVNVSLSACIVVAIVSALTGRQSGTHGISTIAEAFDGFSGSEMATLASGLLTNAFEGAFVVVESLTLDASFPEIYKTLSFSPFPSLIDGFDTIRDVYQIRLSVYVPMSGYVEAYHFGLAYIVLLALIFFASIRLVHKLSQDNHVLYLLCSLFIFIGFYTLNTYPLRNGLKFLWIADTIALLTILFRWKRSPSASAITLRKKQV